LIDVHEYGLDFGVYFVVTWPSCLAT